MPSGRCCRGWLAEPEQTRQPQRLFDQFRYQAGSWPHPRQVVVKAEANLQGTNRRFTVTNRHGAALYPEAAYDDYIQRGENENRNPLFSWENQDGRLHT